MIAIPSLSSLLLVPAALVVLGCGSESGSSPDGNDQSTGGSSTGGSGAGGSATGGSATGGGSAGASSDECSPWTVEAVDGTEATATLDSGALVLRRPGPTDDSSSFDDVFNGDDLALSQVGLTGDFDVTIEWEALRTGGGLWSQIEAGFWWNDPENGSIHQATAAVGGYGARTAIVNDPQFDVAFSDIAAMPSAFEGASGSFHLTKTATGGSATTIINGATASLDAAGPFPAAGYTLFIGIGISAISHLDDLHNEESIRITRVTVTGGGGIVTSDDFDCASLQ